MIAPLSHIARLAHAGFVLARYDVEAPPAIAESIPAPVHWLGKLARLFSRRPPTNTQPTDNAHKLADALVALGPAYIKLGQFLATRPDIIGDELAGDLRVLQDKLPPFPLAEARREVEAELGKPLETVFSEFSAPVAAASIAQVHKARLVAPAEGESEWVAVKLLRPGVEQAFAKDLAAFAWVARMIEGLSPTSRRLEPVKLVETLAASVRLELDLRLEAAAAAEIAELMQPADCFIVPKIDWRLTSRRMLTAPWIDGTRLDDHAALEAAGYDRPALAVLLLSVFLKQALRDGVFHADMHPGNLFVVRDGEDAHSAIVAVDYGIVGRLDKHMQRFMAETLYGFITRDYRRVATAHFEVGFVPPSHSIDEFAQALRSIGEPVFGRTAADISMARLLAQLFEVTRLFDMRLQPQLVLLQKTMVVVEGVARSLDPALDIWQTAKPVVETWMNRELGPEARLQEATEAAFSLVRVATRAPAVLEKMEALANQITVSPDGGGIRLHPDTVRAIAQEEARTTRHARVALWIAAAALAIIAIAALG
ncbi:MAG: 2-polyprenylphenol 6-hydroxylase [Alphaproteobacteria bacterium]